MQDQKSTFLRIISVLVLVFSVLCIGALAMVYLHFIKESDIVMIMGLTMSVVAVAAGVTAGLYGLINSSRPEKMYNCMSWGVAWLVLHIFGQYVAIGSSPGFSEEPNITLPIIGMICGAILPVLLIIAAANFKKKAADKND